MQILNNCFLLSHNGDLSRDFVHQRPTVIGARMKPGKKVKFIRNFFDTFFKDDLTIYFFLLINIYWLFISKHIKCIKIFVFLLTFFRFNAVIRFQKLFIYFFPVSINLPKLFVILCHRQVPDMG